MTLHPFKKNLARHKSSMNKDAQSGVWQPTASKWIANKRIERSAVALLGKWGSGL
jgi:hypothetical protein